MQINESIPNFIIKELNKIKNIKKNNWRLGLAFKPENDDINLSIKLKNYLKNKFKTLQSDEYIHKRNVSKKISSIKSTRNNYRRTT